MTTLGHRPLVHFAAQQGWINDPIGLAKHGDTYRMFSQYIPGAAAWAPECSWLQLTSDDGVRWHQMGTVLEPGEGDDGVWSGSLVVDDHGEAHMFYTSVSSENIHIGRVRVAHAADADWSEWHKGDVVVTCPEGDDVVVFRDPYVVRDGTGWRMVVGGGRRDGTAVAYQWVSEDLENWAFRGVLAERNGSERSPTDGSVWTGTVWECPQLIQVDGAWVLVVAVWEPTVAHYTAYSVGVIESDVFTGSPWRRLTYGPSYYAGSAFSAEGLGTGLIYWLRNTRGTAWTGAHSVPHILHRVGDRVCSTFSGVFADRRSEEVRLDGGEMDRPAVIDVVWSPEEADVVEFGTDDDGWLVRLEIGGESLCASSAGERWEMPWPGGTIRVLSDTGVVEILTEDSAMALPLPVSADLRRPKLLGQGTARAWIIDVSG